MTDIYNDQKETQHIILKQNKNSKYMLLLLKTKKKTVSLET